MRSSYFKLAIRHIGGVRGLFVREGGRTYAFLSASLQEEDGGLYVKEGICAKHGAIERCR